MFLDLQGLAEPCHRRLDKQALYELIERMGFVQLDSISTVERAHHLTLFSRYQTYRKKHLKALIERDRRLFEHWTHDASIIPTHFYPYWKHRFQRQRQRLSDNRWFQERIGDNGDEIVERLIGHIRENGLSMSRDFEDEASDVTGNWWKWGPSKAALEYLWHTGELAVAKRINFQKVYDLAERVIPGEHHGPHPDWDEHVDWHCASALDRLGTATSGEIAKFWDGISPDDAKRWCADNAGRLQTVLIETADGGAPRAALAWRDLEDRLALVREPPARLRFLSPFDPVVRDRNRALRLFGFDYRFEAFVPEPKRQYGYYVLPILEGDRIVGRIDMKHHRAEGRLAVNGLWWEPGVKPGKGRLAATRAELDRLRRFIGAETIDDPAGLAG
jgi:uncharacterized protein